MLHQPPPTTAGTTADEQLKPIFLANVDAARSHVSFSDAGNASVWSVLPPSADAVIGSKEMSSAAASSATSSGLAAITDAAAAYGQNAYYNSTYPGYSMYASTPASYYQQVASGLRAQNAAAAAFPYGLAANPTAYYGGSYPVDYAAYNQQYYQGLRTGYYNPLATPSAYASAASLTTGGANDATSSTSSVDALALKEKKSKTKKKKAGSTSPEDVHFARVFVWDIDDVCMMSRQVVAQITQNPKLHGYVAPALLLKQLVDRIVALNFSDQADDCDMINIEDVAMEESLGEGAAIGDPRGVDMMRRMASKFLSLRQLYQDCAGKHKADACFSYEFMERCGIGGQEEEASLAARQMQSLFNQRWQSANRCLELVTQRSAESQEKYANVVLCGEGLATGAAQLLVAGHASSIAIDNVYSTAKCGKEAIFEKILTRYGKKCSLVCVTSQHETSSIAKKLSIPVWPVTASEDLEKLYTAQRHYLLG